MLIQKVKVTASLLQIFAQLFRIYPEKFNGIFKMKNDQVNFCTDSIAIPIATPPSDILHHPKAGFDGVTQTVVKS